jgi:hypothetical protein
MTPDRIRRLLSTARERLRLADCYARLDPPDDSQVWNQLQAAIEDCRCAQAIIKRRENSR